MTTYYESAEGIEIGFDRACVECRKHGASAVDMLDDLGDFETIEAQTLLEWLGY